MAGLLPPSIILVDFRMGTPVGAFGREAGGSESSFAAIFHSILDSLPRRLPGWNPHFSDRGRVTGHPDRALIRPFAAELGKREEPFGNIRFAVGKLRPLINRNKNLAAPGITSVRCSA